MGGGGVAKGDRGVHVHVCVCKHVCVCIHVCEHVCV